jgi:hypothetical protein
MKRLVDLTRGDLERAPVWRYEGELDEAASVTATGRRELTAREAAGFIARTEFVLGSGEHRTGFCTPCDGGLEETQPAIVTPGGLVFFWFARPATPEALAEQWRLLGTAAHEVFPVHFRCCVPVDGRFVMGVIEHDDLTGAA